MENKIRRMKGFKEPVDEKLEEPVKETIIIEEVVSMTEIIAEEVSVSETELVNDKLKILFIPKGSYINDVMHVGGRGGGV